MPFLHERVAMLTHALTPHRLALIECIAAQTDTLEVFLSQPKDSLHNFPLDFGTLTVALQRSINLTHAFQNVHGYTDTDYISIPLDTRTKLSRFRPTLVISTELGIRSLSAALFKRSNPNVKLVFWATLSKRTEATRGRLRRRLRRWLLQQADAVLVNGSEGSEYVKELGYEGLLCITPYAIDDHVFRSIEYAPIPNSFKLLYTGQLIQRKGLISFCQILNVWCKANDRIEVSLTLVGEGPEHASLLGLRTEDNFVIKIVGRQRQECLREFYRESDIFVFPTLGDEWGVVVNESLSAGRPVLGSVHSQAVNELIHDGVNGWKWDPEEESNLYKIFSLVFSCTPDQLRSMSVASSKSAQHVHPTVISTRVLTFLHDLVNHDGAQDHYGRSYKGL